MLNPTRKDDVAQVAITEGGACIGSITFVAGKNAAAYIDLRDATAAGGTKRIREIRVPSGETVHLEFKNLNVTNGLFAQAWTGTGSVIYVDAE